MSNSSRLLALAGLLLFSLGSTQVAFAAYADPSGRVARLNHTEGDVSYSPAGEDEWFGAMRNRPLARGDRLWSDRGARAELQVGSAAFRLGSDTSFEFLELNDRFAQVQVTQGTINVRVRRLYPGQSYEVATPNLAFVIDRIGRYRIDVDPRDGETTVVVWEGAGQAYGEGSRFSLRAGDTVRFHGNDLRDYEMYGLPRADRFDGYVRERDRRLDGSASLRYVSDDVVGYADLDEYGSWRSVPNYGNAWFPSRVDADWAPYRDGRWVWQDPYGWTWVDEAPWGFAPSHYGRWVHVENRWGWIPGPRNVRPVYAPALVAFVGGSGFGVALSGGGVSIGWFPLGPREVYVPSYRASRDYFSRVNVSNTVVNNTVITNVYNNYSSGSANVAQATYANRAIAGAVTAVPSTVFVGAKPVRQAAIQLDRNAAASGGQITRIAPIAPSAQSVTGAAAAANVRPSREATQRRVVARTAPPPAERPFAAREQQLQKNPGQPVEVPAAEATPAANPAATPNVSVIGAQPNAVDARAAPSRRGGGKPAGAPGQMKPLERTADGDTGNKAPPGERGRDDKNDARDAAAKPAEAPVDAPAAQPQQPSQRERKPEGGKPAAPPQQADKQAANQQQAERQGQAEAQQNAERQRKADSDKAAAQQQAERQGQAEAQQNAQRQRKADNDKAAAQQAERQGQAEAQQNAERQRNADNDKQAAAQQNAERQRKADSDKAAAQQQAERQSQGEAQQNAQRQRKADAEQQPAAQPHAAPEPKADSPPQGRRQPKGEQPAAVPQPQPQPQQQPQQPQEAAPADNQPAKGKGKDKGKGKGKKADKDDPEDPDAAKDPDDPNDPDTNKHEA